MSKARNRSNNDSDDSDFFSDQDVDLHGFLNSMEKESRQRARQFRDHKMSRQRIDDMQEARWLRDQLSDWDD